MRQAQGAKEPAATADTPTQAPTKQAQPGNRQLKAEQPPMGGKQPQPARKPEDLSKRGQSGRGDERSKKLDSTRAVELIFHAPQARQVTVAGTFNQWEPAKTSLRREQDGVWKATLSLAPGRYEYRFVVDGEWLSDPRAGESAPNEFGSTNSILAV